MITRFAPSPTGLLHLGHGYSVLFAHDRAQACGGEVKLRIEDIDHTRARASYTRAIFEDLDWLGIAWSSPVMHQSRRRQAHGAALDRLAALGVCFPCRCTRRDIRANLAAPHEGDHDTVYPGTCRGRRMVDATGRDAIRLDMRRALDLFEEAQLMFEETGPLHPGRRSLDRRAMLAEIGDVVLVRRDIGPSYHLSVVVDDAEQGITEVVRGADLFAVTPLHRLLQALLDLHAPRYCHHMIIRDADGARLAKRAGAASLRAYREQGVSPADLREMLGLGASA